MEAFPQDNPERVHLAHAGGFLHCAANYFGCLVQPVSADGVTGRRPFRQTRSRVLILQFGFAKVGQFRSRQRLVDQYVARRDILVNNTLV